MSIINGDWPPKEMAEVDHWGFQVALSQLRECAGVVGQWMNLPSGYVKIAIENDHRNSGFSH